MLIFSKDSTSRKTAVFRSTLAAPCSPGDTSIHLESGDGDFLPTLSGADDKLVLLMGTDIDGIEVVCTGRSGDVLTCEAVQAAPSDASVWAYGTLVSATISPYMLRQFVQRAEMGTAAFEDISYFASASDGALARSALQSAPVTTVAGRTGAVTLSHGDLTDWATATAGFLTSAPVTSVAGRSGAVSLSSDDVSGLGNAATRNVGTGSGQVAAGDHSHGTYIQASGFLQIMFADAVATTQSIQFDKKSGLLELAPLKSWRTIADAKASPPVGWTWMNASNLVTADCNSTVADALYLNAGSGSYDFNPSVATSPYLFKTYTISGVHGAANWNFFARVVLGSNNGSWAGIGIRNSSIIANKARILVNNPGTGCQIYADGYGTSGAMSATITTAQRDAGVWILVCRSGQTIGAYYSVSNSATPPPVSEFSSIMLFSQSFFANDLNPIDVGFLIGGSSSTKTASFLYYDDSINPAPIHLSGNNRLSASGFDSSNPILALIVDRNVGAGAIISDADLRAALIPLVNLRENDWATVSFSAVRSSAPGAGTGTFSSASTVSIAGSGAYFSLYVKFSSTGLEGGSFDVKSFRLFYLMSP